MQTMISQAESTSVVKRGKAALAAAVDALRNSQDNQGRWLGAHRSTHLIYYAIGLALDNEPADSPVIQDICDFVESWAADDGGFGDYPGEPPNGFQTCLIAPLLKWARPQSPALKKALIYLQRTGQYYQDPTILLSQYVFDPGARKRVLADKGPPEWARKVILALSEKHLSERWALTERYPKFYPPLSLFDRLLKPFIVRACTFAPVSSPDKAAELASTPTGFDLMLFIQASLRRLAGDTGAGVRRLYELALSRRKRFIYDDGSYEWIAPLVGDLFFTKTFGLEEEYKNAARRLREIEYLGSGWMNGTVVTVHVFDTALTILGLLEAGHSASHPMIKSATDYLVSAISPVYGLWTWSYCEGMGKGRPYQDTDDSGAVLMALKAASSNDLGAFLNNAAEKLKTCQDPSGAFSLFGDAVVRPNWAWLSNTSRAVQGLLACGVAKSDESIERAIDWIMAQRLDDGSWIDGWCCRYIYGTVMALEALLAAGKIQPGDEIASAAVNWLLGEQNADGGWGENWSGARTNSTAEHTGLALYGLCMASDKAHYPRTAIEKGARWLTDAQRPDGLWDCVYFMDFGFGVGVADAQLSVVWALHGLGRAMSVLSAD